MPYFCKDYQFIVTSDEKYKNKDINTVLISKESINENEIDIDKVMELQEKVLFNKTDYPITVLGFYDFITINPYNYVELKEVFMDSLVRKEMDNLNLLVINKAEAIEKIESRKNDV